MISIAEWVGMICVLLIGCMGAVALVIGVFILPFHAVERWRARRAPRTERNRAARDSHAAAVRDYCVSSPDYTMAVSLLHEGEVTDLLGLALKLAENDHQDEDGDVNA